MRRWKIGRLSKIRSVGTEIAYRFHGTHSIADITLKCHTASVLLPSNFGVVLVSYIKKKVLQLAWRSTTEQCGSTLQGVWSCSAADLCSTGASMIYNVMPDGSHSQAGSSAEQQREQVEVNRVGKRMDQVCDQSLRLSTSTQTFLRSKWEWKEPKENLVHFD